MSERQAAQKALTLAPYDTKELVQSSGRTSEESGSIPHVQLQTKEPSEELSGERAHKPTSRASQSAEQSPSSSRLEASASSSLATGEVPETEAQVSESRVVHEVKDAAQQIARHPSPRSERLEMHKQPAMPTTSPAPAESAGRERRRRSSSQQGISSSTREDIEPESREDDEPHGKDRGSTGSTGKHRQQNDVETDISIKRVKSGIAPWMTHRHKRAIRRSLESASRSTLAPSDRPPKSEASAEAR